MITEYELMNIHVRALFTHNDESRLLLVNEPNGAPVPAPRLYLGRTRAGSVWRFRADVSEDIIEELGALCADEPQFDIEFKEPPRHLAAFVRLLEQHAPVQKVSSGPAYQFIEHEKPSKILVAVTENNAETLLKGKFEDLILNVAVEQPFVALVKEDRAVSVCRSVRITSEAHEAGLETLTDFRGKGYAGAVAAEWARLVSTGGVIPLYSTSWENSASQSVARKLGLKCYGADFYIA